MPKNSMRNKIATLLLLIITLGMVSCDDKTVYHHYEHVPGYVWEKNDTLTFSIPPVAEEGTYQEQLEMRINGDYPFLSLTMLVDEHILPLGGSHRYAYTCELMDKYGTPLGEGVSYYQYRFDMNELNLNKGDSLVVYIVHNMKRELIPGISDVGLRLRRK
jgi:gliding motility-associated lipoprotein GldH